MRRLPLISWVALALWLATVVGVGLVFLLGGAAPGEDGRSEIRVSKDEKRFILTEMRQSLAGVQDIVLALDADDLADVTAAVEGKGVADMMRNTPKALIASLPPEFLALGRAMHQGFDEIGAAAADGADKARIIALLGDQLGRCVACHASYQLVDEE